MSNSLIQLPLKDVEAFFAASSIEIVNANQDKEPAKALADLSKEQIETATKRLDVLEGAKTTVTKRTHQRWRKKILGLLKPLDKIIALVDDTRSKGNNTARLPQKAEELADRVIKTRYNTPTCPTATGVYHEYEVLCAENNVKPMSYPTFTKRVNDQHSVKAREGNRKDYQESPIPLLLDYASPIHGVLPHEVCYIDHTIMNIFLIGPGGTQLGKPTFTLATDGHTTQARAFYLSFDPPSINVVYMALRDYVRRWGRLPRRLVVDRGPEFRSEELRWFCRLYGIDIILRPKAMPRGGSQIERAIGVAESELLAQLEGNTRIMKNVRMVTKSVDPVPRAIWTLPSLYGALDEYLFEIRPERIHPVFGMTPHEYEQMRILETGARKHLLVRFDENFLLLTSSHASRPFHKVDPIRGVWESNAYYCG